MSVKSVVGNLEHGINDSISTALRSAKQLVDQAVGDLANRAVHIWDGGFIGMSYDGVGNLKASLKKYCETIQEQIDKFNANAEIDKAIKGTVIEYAMHQYLDSVKDLLKAYVSTLKQEIAELDEAYANFVVTTQASISRDVEAVASDITKEAQEITNESGNIKLD